MQDHSLLSTRIGDTAPQRAGDATFAEKKPLDRPQSETMTMKAFFQHPETGVACGAEFNAAKRLLLILTEDGDEVLRRTVNTVRDASQELVRFGVPADEAGFGA